MERHYQDILSHKYKEIQTLNEKTLENVSLLKKKCEEIARAEQRYLDALLKDKLEKEGSKLIHQFNQVEFERIKEAKKEEDPLEQKFQEEKAQAAELKALPELSYFGQLVRKYSNIYITVSSIADSPSILTGDEKMDLRMRLNKRVGQVSPSRSQVQTISADILSLFSMAGSPDKLRYLMKILSDKVLAQCETQIGAHPPSSFPLAALLRILFEKANFTLAPNCTLLDYFFGKLCTDCPLLNFDTKETIVADKHLGIIYLFGAFLVTSDFLNNDTAFDIPLAWSYLVHLINMLSRSPSNTVALVSMVTFLENAAFSLYKFYSIQFYKLILFIKQHLLSVVPQSQYSVRLSILVDKWLVTEGLLIIEIPEGFKMTN